MSLQRRGFGKRTDSRTEESMLRDMKYACDHLQVQHPWQPHCVWQWSAFVKGNIH